MKSSRRDPPLATHLSRLLQRTILGANRKHRMSFPRHRSFVEYDNDGIVYSPTLQKYNYKDNDLLPRNPPYFYPANLPPQL